MTINEELNTALYKKMFAEQANFRSWLLSQPPEEILNHTYEYTVREDILMALECNDLESTQARILLSSPAPLQDIFSKFEHRETDYMDVVRDCMESRAGELLRQQKEQYQKIPVYPYPASYAREHGELEQYRASHRANIDCEVAIENAIAENYQNNVLPDAAAQQVVDLFGFDRTMFVLANTVREKDHDGRISRDNKEWAKTIPVFEDVSGGRNRRLDYVIDRSHPGLVDIFVRQVRRAFQLTQPLTSLEIANEAHRICEKLQSLREPNSPNKTHFMAQLSPDFMLRASTKDTEELQKWLPDSLALTTVKGQKGVFAMLGKDESRNLSLRSPKERKPSVRDKLRQPLETAQKDVPQKKQEQQR